MIPRPGPVRLLKDVARGLLDGPREVPLPQRVRMTRLGFKVVEYFLYELDRNEPSDYVPTALWAPLNQTNGRIGSTLIGNKLLFYLTYRDELPLPHVYAVVANGHVRAVASSGVDAPEAVLDRLRDGPLILKPIDGQKGKRVRMLSATGDQVLLDGTPVAGDAARAAIVSQEALVVEHVSQAAYAAAVYPRSANSVRVLVIGGAGTGNEPFVAALAHRFGTAESAPADNWSRGGVMGRVEPDTLTLGRVASHGVTARPTWRDDHPETGTVIAGLRVPQLRDPVRDILTFSREHPYLAFVGWDVLLTDDGYRILEANYGPSLQTQMFGFPLRRDERVAPFLKHHGLADRLIRQPPAA